MDGFEGKMRLY